MSLLEGRNLSDFSVRFYEKRFYILRIYDRINKNIFFLGKCRAEINAFKG